MNDRASLSSQENNMDPSVRNFVATAERSELEAAVAKLWRLEDASRALLTEAEMPRPEPVVMSARVRQLREAVDVSL